MRSDDFYIPHDCIIKLKKSVSKFWISLKKINMDKKI